MKNILVMISISVLLSYMAPVYGFEKNSELGSIISNEGYPYNLLVQRTDQVKLIYSGENSMTCKVEVHNKGQVWHGQSHSTNEKRFLANPLARCMDRALAKSIVKTTF